MTNAEERTRFRIAAGLALLFIIAHLAAGWTRGTDRLLYGDARRYYLYLPSLWIDHDLDFANNARALDELADNGEMSAGRVTAIGRTDNLAPIGPALLWSPFFLVGLVVQALARTLAGSGAPWDPFGWTPQAFVAAGNVLYAAAATLLTARVLDRWFERRIATVCAFTIWLATPAVYYSLVSPSYAHAGAWFVIAAGIAVWMSARERPGTARWLAAGALFGLAATIRPQDGMFLGLPLLDLAWRAARDRNLRAAAIPGVALAAGCFAGVLPQLVTWRINHGTWLVNQLEADGAARWLQPDLAHSLFGLGTYGLFTWAPVALIGVVGLALFARRQPAFAFGALILVGLAAYFEASVPVLLETGTAFGARRFVSHNVAFAVGLATVWQAVAPRMPRAPLLVCVLLVGWNGILVVGYQWMVRAHGVYPGLTRLVSWLFTGNVG